MDIAEDYTKRKHVLRVVNPTAEVLLQMEDAASMALWLRSLHKYAATEKPLVNLFINILSNAWMEVQHLRVLTLFNIIGYYI